MNLNPFNWFKKPSSPENPSNPTIYSDKPIKGGETKIVINDLQVRQAVRTTLGINNWRTALVNAESRYFPNRVRLYDIYFDIILDGHLSGVIQKRIDTVINKEIFYKDKNGEVIEEMNPFIRSFQFRRIMVWILETQLWGITAIEFIPGPTLQPRLIPRKHVNPKTQKIIIEQTNQEVGFDYTTLDNVWVIGEPEDLGLLLKCAPYVIYKRGMMGDWAQYIEVFGMPIRTMYYDANDVQAKIELKGILDSTGSALALMIPKGVDFKLEDGKTSNGNGELQDTFNRVLNSEMSITILGNTETTSSGSAGGGSLAKSKIHQDQQDQIAKSDIIYLTAQLNDPQFIKILQSYAWPVVEGGMFEVNKDIDITFLAQRAQIDNLNIQSGVEIAQEYFYETYNYPKPEAGQKLVNLPAPAPGAPGSPASPPRPAPKKPTDLADTETQPLTPESVKNIITDTLKTFFDPAR